MKLKFLILATVSTIIDASFASAQLTPANAELCDPTVFSVWDSGGGTEITITDCGDMTPCGRITKLSDPDLPDGNNRDEALKAKPLLGRLILSGFRSIRGEWKKGKIYNPSNGKYYKSSIRLQSDDQLLVKGCVGPFCEKQIWSRIGKRTCSKQ